MISTWYTDRNIIEDLENFEFAQKNYFESKILEELIQNFKNTNNNLSELYVIGLITFLVSIVL